MHAMRHPALAHPRHAVFGTPLPPIWPSEPSLAHLEAIAREHLDIPADNPCTIDRFADGAFNKLYTIASDTLTKQYLIRVALPVEPRLKTLSEVATIELVRTHATELVPRISAYSADAAVSGLGYEWMLMENMHGGPLEDCWEGMEWEAKVALMKTLVGVLGKLYGHPLEGIGNIYPTPHSSTISATATIGPIVSTMFFWDDHYELDVPRGPFRCSHDWLRALLQFTLNNCAKTLAQRAAEDDPDPDDEDEREEALLTQALVKRLVRLLPRIFPLPGADSVEPTALRHDDLTCHNLLADGAGQLTGIVDWECVSALPLWCVCTLPQFLRGRTRTEQPYEATYMRDEDGRITELYAEHVLEWERTQFRAVLLEEMEHVQPEWVRMYKDPANALKRDFYEAVISCEIELYRRRVGEWVGQVERMSDEEIRTPSGMYKSLEDELVL
ncbi:unnamed protein product [Peniophora sp. CBMAI 1063]|nr:unnamed protein product [Peniophora sp. CBMAI 1063]